MLSIIILSQVNLKSIDSTYQAPTPRTAIRGRCDFSRAPRGPSVHRVWRRILRARKKSPDFSKPFLRSIEGGGKYF